MVRMMVGRDLKDFYVAPTDKNHPTASENWFTVRNLRTLKYPQHTVNLTVARGEILGLAGLVGRDAPKQRGLSSVSIQTLVQRSPQWPKSDH
jgi:ABC-type sugar transport system ATPase subunit